jgi:serine/threonine-protein kinase
MAEPSAKSFLKILERSGIVPEDRLKQTLAELSKKYNGQLVKVDDLTSHLISSGVLTRWHCDKLLAGKYKGFFLGKYKLLGHLGTGGMSSVYLAEHKLSGQKRAIKVLPRKKVSDKSYLDRFYREGKAAACLNDPNVVRIYDICNEGDTHYMVMEWVDGIDLYELVKKDGSLPFDDAADYILQAAKGLSHAHEKNLVHRDIKPANLLLARDGVVKILDLGLALMREEAESLTILHNERVMGTADYLAPEQAVNSHNVDHRADIYSLGCTLYYLLTGHPPFPEGSLAQRIAMHQTTEPAPIISSRKDCPQALIEICQRMMKKNRNERFQNCSDVEQALKKFRETGTFEGDDSPGITITTKRIASQPAGNSGAPRAIAASGESPVSISTTGQSDSFKVASSQNATKFSHRKKRSALPIWALALIIAFMFVALILVLYLAIRLSGANATAALGSIKLPPVFGSLLGLSTEIKI